VQPTAGPWSGGGGGTAPLRGQGQGQGQGQGRALLGAFEWSVCARSGLLKPPRAHYDGESFLRVHWVAVPKTLRARRVNRRDWAAGAELRSLLRVGVQCGGPRQLPLLPAHGAASTHALCAVSVPARSLLRPRFPLIDGPNPGVAAALDRATTLLRGNLRQLWLAALFGLLETLGPYRCGAVASFLAAVLTELYLCNVCSCQEILRSNGAARAQLSRWRQVDALVSVRRRTGRRPAQLTQAPRSTDENASCDHLNQAWGGTAGGGGSRHPVAANASSSSRSMGSSLMLTAAEVELELDALWRLLTLCAVCLLVVGHFGGWHLLHCVGGGRAPGVSILGG
jgi:hypothetical protein